MREQKNEKRKRKGNIRLHYHKGALDSARTTEKRNKGLFEVSESSPKGQEVESSPTGQEVVAFLQQLPSSLVKSCSQGHKVLLLPV